MAPKANFPLYNVLRNLDVDESAAADIAESAVIFGWYIHNNNAAVLYLKLYDQATAADENDTPKMTVPIPAGAGANVEFEGGIPFTSGLSLRATTGVADNDTGAPDANDVVVNIFYL